MSACPHALLRGYAHEASEARKRTVRAQHAHAHAHAQLSLSLHRQNPNLMDSRPDFEKQGKLRSAKKKVR